ncbi:MAG TPA: CoA ester lyase, partial [Burkholderiaceae bacterium]
MTTPAAVRRPRSMLFVSGEQVERFPKAMAAGADLVCIDLEDAVHPDRKAQARTQVLGWLKEQQPALAAAGRQVALRLNGVRTGHGLRDLHALIDAGLHVDWLLLPKVEDAADLQCVDAWAGAQLSAQGGIVALVETPLGIERAATIARAGGRVAALMLGGADLSAELGAQFGWDGLLSARGRLVNAARSAGLQAWDVPHVDIKKLDELSSETRRVLALGFDCKSAIHPSQVAVIHAAFAPTPTELEWAERIVAAVPDGQASGAFLVDGRMVDAPLIRKARRIVEIA